MNNEGEKLTINFEVTAAEAIALAQFFKRTAYSDCKEKAVSSAEAYEMMDGINAAYKGLREAGFNPR